MKMKWLDEHCKYCDGQLNSWDKRIGKALCFDFSICEKCIAEEYGMTVEYLRDRRIHRFGMHPCEGL